MSSRLKINRDSSRADRRAQLTAEMRRYGLRVVRPDQHAAYLADRTTPRTRPAA
jgi:hypothetical protein